MTTTGDTSAAEGAIDLLRVIAARDNGQPEVLFPALASDILAHIAALEARAEQAEAREAELRAAAERLNAELDAFWNEPVEIKYPEGRMNVVYEQLITDAQMACRQALAAVPAAPEKPSGESGWLPADPPAEWIEAMADSVHDELCKLFDTYLLHDEEAAKVARSAYAALARKMGGGDAE